MHRVAAVRIGSSNVRWIGYRSYGISVRNPTIGEEQETVPWLKSEETIYSSLTTSELLRAAVVYTLCEVPYVVSQASRLLHVSNAILGRRVTNELLKHTFFGHFCGGEQSSDLQEKVRRLKSSGVLSILDYAAESDVSSSSSSISSAVSSSGSHAASSLSEATLASHEKIFLACIDEAKAMPRGFAAMKVTGVCDVHLLEKLNRVAPRNLSTDVAHADEIEPMLSAGLDSEADRASLSVFLGRLDRIAAHARRSGVRILVDAEQSYFQNAIRAVTLRAMVRHNADYPTLFTTHQCYLKNSYATLQDDLRFLERHAVVVEAPNSAASPPNPTQSAGKKGPYFGVKVVRGAYMTTERQLAAQAGTEDPIYATKDETNENYDRVCESLLAAGPQDPTELLMATHNEVSVAKGIECLRRYRIPKGGGKLCFAQLLGMRDNISLALGREGFLVYKYIPYGPVEEVIPYLLRRMEENSSSSTMLIGLGREKAQIRSEIARRLNPLRRRS